MSSESDPSPLRHLLVLGLSPPSPSSSSSTLGHTSSSRQRTFLCPLPSPPQRSHLQHLLRHLVAQSRGSLLPPLGSFSTSEANSSAWATEKSGTSVSDELVLLNFFNLLLSRLSSRSPFLFAPATHRLAVADQIPLLLSVPLLILPLSSPLPCLLTLLLLFPRSTLISP